MKKVLLFLAQMLSLGLAAILAAVLGLWLAVILSTDSRMKQSFADTLRLSGTVTSVALELLRGGHAMEGEDFTLRANAISQATLVLMKDTGVSGIFRTGDIRRFSKPKDVQRLAEEFNRFLGNTAVEQNRLIKAGTSFYLILLDLHGNRRSYEFIGDELFLNDGTLSRLLRRQSISEDPPLGMADFLGTSF